MDLSIIATKAIYNIKVNKKKAYETLIEVINGNGKITDDQLAVFYSFFLSKSKKPVNKFDWLRSACGKTENWGRECLQYIYSDGKKLVSTDGHRMHIVYEKYPIGYYDRAGVKLATNFGEYPDIDKLIPQNNTKEFIFLNQQKHSINNGNGVPIVYIGGTWFNVKFIQEALCGENKMTLLYTVDAVKKGGNPLKAIRFETKYGDALVMAVRID